MGRYKQILSILLIGMLCMESNLIHVYADQNTNKNVQLVSDLNGEIGNDTISQNTVSEEKVSMNLVTDAIVIRSAEELETKFPPVLSGTTLTFSIDKDIQLTNDITVSKAAFRNGSGYDTVVLLPKGNRTIYCKAGVAGVENRLASFTVTDITLKLGNSTMQSENTLTIDGGAKISFDSNGNIHNSGVSGFSGPLYIQKSATVEMYNGVTIHNYFFPEEEVLIYNMGTFRMKGGTITENYLYGANTLTLGTQGVLCNDGRIEGTAPVMEISGGSIVDNYTEGPCIGNTINATMKISGGRIQSALESHRKWFNKSVFRTGVDNNGTLIMTGGSIQEFTSQIESRRNLRFQGGTISGYWKVGSDGTVEGNNDNGIKTFAPYPSGPFGKVEITGGVIEKCANGVAAVGRNNEIQMTGGQIRNVVTGISMSGDTYTANDNFQLMLSGGTIGKALAYGVHMDNGVCTLSNTGVIQDCNSNGIYSEGSFSKVFIKGGVIQKCGPTESGSSVTNTGGGIRNYGTCEMSGGIIQYCKSGVGAGISNEYRIRYTESGEAVPSPGKLIMTGGTIQYCKAGIGGGGVNNYGDFQLSGGIIQKNTADYGGGVENGGHLDIYENRAVMTMKGGTIQENHANECGGGMVLYTCTTDLNSGKIINNTSKNPKAGVAGISETTTIGSDLIMTGNKVTGKSEENKTNLKVKQTQKVNLFYKDGTGILKFTSSSAEIESVKLLNPSKCSFNLTYDSYTQMATVSQNADIPTKSDGLVNTKKIQPFMKLEITFADGSIKTVSKKIEVETKRPKVILNPTAVNLYPKWNNYETEVSLYLSKEKKTDDIAEYDYIKSLTREVNVTTTQNGMLELAYSGKKNKKLRLEILRNNWRKKQVINGTINIRIPQAVLSKKRVIVNKKVLSPSSNAIGVSLKGNTKLTLSASQIKPYNTKAKRAVSENMIQVSSDDKGQLTVKYSNDLQSLRKGEYIFRITPKILEAGEGKSAKAVPLTIYVTDKNR